MHMEDLRKLNVNIAAYNIYSFYLNNDRWSKKAICDKILYCGSVTSF